MSTMSAIETLLRQPAAQAVGWALLHFVWQGTLIAALTAVALAALRTTAADVRYVVSTIALSLMLTMPMMTATQSWRAPGTAPDLSRGTAAACKGAAAAGCESASIRQIDERAGASPLSPGRPFAAAADSEAVAIPPGMGVLNAIMFEAWLPLLVFGWLCGVAALSLRLMSGWLWVQRMKSHGTAPAADGWQATATRLSRRLHIGRRVRLLESTLVEVPTVIGWLKPAILLPASALAGLTPQQLEAILAHELAHIRRHDYLVNLLQTLVETLLFYHPAVWWLSRRIRMERENCCDDLAVSLCGDPFTYAKALADLEELRGSGGRLVMAANGGSLVQRIRRLLGAPTHAGRGPGWLAGSAAVVVMLGMAAGAANTNAFQSSSAPVTAASPSSFSSGLPVTQSPGAEAAVVPTARGEARVRESIGDEPPDIAAEGAAEGQPAVVGRAEEAQDRARSMAVQAEIAGRQEVLPGVQDGVSVMSAARGRTVAEIARVLPGSVVAGGFGGVGQTHGTFTWSNDGEKLDVKYDGEIELSDDDTDVKKLSPGGSLKIKDGWMLSAHTVELTADASGNITRRFWVGFSERPFEPEGRQWVAKMLPRFIRQTGIGAAARVARILKARGPAGVLAEIALIEGSWGKKIYFTELLRTASLDSATVRQVLAQAGREIDSDFELASLLIDSADKLMIDEGTRQAYFEAARSIESDFEMRRVYSSALKRGPVSGPVLAGILDASRHIDSDFEEASLLIQIAKLQPLDNTTRAPFFAALGTVESDFEHRRVLSALADRTDLTQETIGAMLTSGATVQSDFEAASFLLQVARQQPIEGALRAPFFRAVDSIGSSFERSRVLEAVAARPDASQDTVLAALRAAATMDGGFERSKVLLAIAQSHTLSGAARDAYIDAAEKLGEFEQGKVLAALVRSERRK